MSRDILLFGMGSSDHQYGLSRWADVTPNLHWIQPDPRRLQLERWLWEKLTALPRGASVMDVGQHETPRRWVGDGYFVFGLAKESDVVGDLTALPMANDSLDVVVCTEVLEHCANPFKACQEIRRVLKPRGVLYASCPFAWPDHHSDDYPDYWRFTEQGWELLLADFSEVKIEAHEWSEEGAMLYDLLRRFECMGLHGQTSMTTGFQVEAVK